MQLSMKSVRFSSLINDRKLRIVNVIKAKVIQQFQRTRMRHLIEEQLFTDYLLFTNCQSRNEKLIKSEKTDYYYNNFKWLGFWPMWLYHCYFKFVLPVLTKHYYWKVVSLRIDKLSCLNFLKPENWYHISLTTKYMENKGMHSVFGSFKHVSASVIILIKCNYHFLGFLFFSLTDQNHYCAAVEKWWLYQKFWKGLRKNKRSFPFCFLREFRNVSSFNMCYFQTFLSRFNLSQRFCVIKIFALKW